MLLTSGCTVPGFKFLSAICLGLIRKPKLQRNLESNRFFSPKERHLDGLDVLQVPAAASGGLDGAGGAAGAAEGGATATGGADGAVVGGCTGPGCCICCANCTGCTGTDCGCSGAQEGGCEGGCFGSVGCDRLWLSAFGLAGRAKGAPMAPMISRALTHKGHTGHTASLCKK